MLSVRPRKSFTVERAGKDGEVALVSGPTGGPTSFHPQS